MTRYERTGENRRAVAGEWYEHLSAFDALVSSEARQATEATRDFVWILRRVAEPEAKPGLCPKCGSDEWVGDLTTAFDFGSQVSCYKCGYFELRDPANEESRVREEERRARWKPTQEPAPARPGTEDANRTGNWKASDSEIIRILEHARDGNEWLSGTYTDAIDEAIRRIRAHDKLRAALAGMASEYANRPVVPKSEIGALLAILDSEAP